MRGVLAGAPLLNRYLILLILSTGLVDELLEAGVLDMCIHIDRNQAKHRLILLSQYGGRSITGVQCQALHLREEARGHVLPYQLESYRIAGAGISSRLEVKEATISGIGNVEMGGIANQVCREGSCTRDR